MRKLLVCMLMVLALVAFSGVAMAQDPVCGSLSASDCEILTQSAAAQAGLTSATFTFTLDINAGGQAVPLTGDGSYAVDPAVIAAFDPAAMTNMTDPTAMLGILGDLIKGFDGELNVNAMGMPINLLLVDGVGFINFEPFAPFLAGAPVEIPAGWAGLDLVGALDMLAPMLGSMEMPDVQTQVDPNAQAAIMEAVVKYVTISRAADENGQAVFVTSVDFGALFQDEAFLGFVMAQAMPGQELTEEMMAQVGPMLQGLGGGFTFSATQKVDLSTFFATSIGFEFNLNGAALSAVAGETVQDVSVAGAFNFADFNAAPALSAPAGAPVATIMDLMGLMGGGF
ncbi:MAG: hypothetical protein IPK52_09120 [Chloroflexi bacterium]|nr:hypothetical protein [Chloroflexota bacterium]